MTTPDVRVRLSAEGVKEVVSALKTVQAQADRSNRSAAGGLGSIKKVVGELKNLLPALGLAAVSAGIVAMGKAALASADAMGKLAEKTGASVEDASSLVVAGRLVDVSQQQVQTALAKTAIAVGELQAGNKTAARSFAQLGLSAQDFAGRDTGQAIELLSQRIAAIEDPFRRAEAAAAIFGSRLAADLMPLINELADRGLVNLRTQAEELGLLITGDLAAAADAAGDSFDLMKLQAQGLATSFIAGLAPSIVSTMGDFAKATKGDGVESMKRFGAETGRVLRTVIATFRAFATIVSAIFTKLGNNIGGVFAAAEQALKGNFRQAWTILGDITEQNRMLDAESGPKIKAALAEIARQASSDAPPITLKPTIDKSKLSAEVLQAMLEADRAAAAAGAGSSGDAAARRAAAEAKRIAEERIRAEEAAGRARFDLEQRLLEITGQQREAKIRALDEELAKQRQIIAEAGAVTPVDEQRFARLREVELARIDFSDAFERASRELESLATQRARIEQDVELGITTEREGQRQIAALEAARLPVLRDIAAAVLSAAQASADPALIAQAEQLNLQLGQVQISVAKAADEWLRFREQAVDAVGNDLTNFLTEGVKDVKNLEDAFVQLGDTILATLQRIAVEQFIRPQIESWLGSLFGGLGGLFGGGTTVPMSAINMAPFGMKRGGVIGLAGGGLVDGTGGGLISGPGTGTSDSIPAITTSGRRLLLSNGEGIVNARAMAKPGVLDLLRTLNGRWPVFSPPARQSRFAEGGVVADAPVGGMTVVQHFNIKSATGSIDRTSREQVGAEAARGLARANRRNN